MADPNAAPTVTYRKNCGNQVCTCQTSAHESYCSEQCEHPAPPVPGAHCPCEHRECKGRSA